MYNLAIIGAGQLGSRHLQGLSLSNLPLNIQVLDLNPKSLEIAKQRFDEIATSNLQIELIDNIALLNNKLDLVIVATSSKPRCSIIENLLSEKNVDNLILEKFLFPDLNDYEAIGALLKNKKLFNNTWVNCTRRLFNGYKLLEQELRNRTFSFSYVGKDWGLACNSIHYLDLVQMLSGSPVCEVNLDLLENEVHQSKREGYIEFAGTVKSKTDSNCDISLSSLSTGNFDERIIIIDGDNRWEIAERNDTISKNGTFWAKISMKYQSQLTGTLVDEIFNTGNCSLPSFQESKDTHIVFLRELVKFYNGITNNSGTFCPIT